MSPKRPKQVTLKELAAAMMVWMAGAIGASGEPLLLQLPGQAAVIGERHEQPSRYLLPVGAYVGPSLPVKALEGALDRMSYRLDASRQSTLDLMMPLRQQLLDLGYAVLFECATVDCGGYDFRYAMDVLPEPQMLPICVRAVCGTSERTRAS